MADTQHSSLICCVNAEWMNSQGSILRKVTYKSVTLRLIRNEYRDIFLEIDLEKSKQRYLLAKITVHKKFLSEGKASINFTEQKMVIFISNAPPVNLLGFLKTMYVKMNGISQTPKVGVRQRLLSSKPQGTDEISPMTEQELRDAKAKAKVNDTTPTGTKKRPLAERNANMSGSVKSADTSRPTAAKKICVAPISQLTNEQKRVLDEALQGSSIFFTGSAGTGKSFLLRRIISALPPDVTVATASTGVAACLIGGTTLHSFAGIGKGTAPIQRCIELAMRPSVRAVWRKVRHLVIDEISMVDGAFFEKLEEVARAVRGQDKPFGGIQLILCGDFFQLAPVCKDQESMDKRFCFQSPAWNKCVKTCFELRQVHRQKDPQFVNILQHIRIGKATPEIAAKLMETSNQSIERDGILATRLCSHTIDSDLINKSRLEELTGTAKTFKSTDSLPELSQLLDQLTPVNGTIVLKIGAQVMLVKNSNVSSGLVNGARGVVKSFDGEGLPVIRFCNNQEIHIRHERWTVKLPGGGVGTRRQLPLKLAWAFSIHKSQGLTLDCVEMSLARVFEAGQAYVALSRAQSIRTLRVLDFDAKQVWANADVIKFYKRLHRIMDTTEIVPVKAKYKKS